MIDLCHSLCAQLAAVAPTTSHAERLAAAALVLERATDITPVVVPVRAALYARSAALRLGGSPMPAHQGEIDHFREQIGPGMVLLGFDEPHAVLAIGEVIIEVADAADWNSRGVLLHPFIHSQQGLDVWTVDGLHHGVVITYERATNKPAWPTAHVDAHEFASRLERAIGTTARQRNIGA